MAEQPKNQIIVIEPCTKTVNELLEMITERDQAEIQPFLSADEAIQCTRQFLPCMLVICIQSNNDIPAILGTLKQLKTDIKAGLVKTLLVSKVKNPQLQKLIGEFGVTDYIEEPIPARTLQFKANLQLKAIDTTRKQIELRKKNEEKIVFKTSKAAADEAQATGADVKTRNKPALQLANDTFLIKNGSVKKQGKKFVVELDGPDPSTGEWVADGEKDGETNWRWKPHDKEDEPGSDDGDGWVSTGDRPVFKAANKKWQMSSEKPSLLYRKNKTKVAEKIGTDEKGEVEVAEDSPAAEENLKKNLVKSMRNKKRKQAEAAGLPFEEEEGTKPVAAKATPAEEEQEAEAPAAINRVKRKVKRPKLDAKGQPIPGEEEEVEVEVDEPAESEAESDGRKKLEKLRQARRKKKEAALAAGLPVEEEPDEQEAGKPDATEEEAEDEGTDPLALVKRQKKRSRAAKADGQLLDFLQKKKEQVKPAQKAEGETREDPAEAPTAGEAPEEELSKAAALLKRARERKARAKKNGMEGVEDALAAGGVDGAAETAEEDSDTGGKIHARKKEEETETEDENDELSKELRERRRKRAAKKKALLEEIQEESEPTKDELETIERKRKAKAEGAEEEIEEEASPERNERLEKLRRKREELAQLEREEEEEEKMGDHLHTLRADERRGMNAWDTDESVEADDEETKRLKRLAREKREQAEREAKEKAEKERLEALAAEEAETGKKSGKKRISGGTQADGLESAFAEEERKKESEDLYGSDEEEAPEGETRSERLERLRTKRDKEKAAKAEVDDFEKKRAEQATEESLSGGEEADTEEEISLTEKLAQKKKEKDEKESQATEAKTEAKEGKSEKERRAESESEELSEEKDVKQTDSSGEETSEQGKRDRSEKTASSEEKSGPNSEAEEKAAKKEMAAGAEAEKTRAEEITEDFSRKRVDEAAAPLLSAKDKLAQKSKTSESMKKFLERRKQKKEAETIDLGLEKKAAGEEPGKRSFLGIFVAISDSFGMASDRKILNILRAFEMSLENCAAALTTPGEGTVKVLCASSLEKGSDIALAGCRVETFRNDQGALIGNLVLRMIEPRTAFEADESETIQRAVKTLRPLALQWFANSSEKEKAA